MEKPREKQCERCGAIYQPKKMAHRQKYCSIECRRQFRQKESVATLERHCPVCGSTFTVENKQNRRKYCSDACHKEHVNAQNRKVEVAEKQCPVCGSTFCCGPNRNQKYCSVQCRQKQAKVREAAARKHEAMRECPVCGETFTVEGRAIGRSKYCSKVCSRRACKEHSDEAQELTVGQLTGENCLNCDAVIEQIPGQKRRSYCNRICERKFYYRTNPEQRDEIRWQIRKLQPDVLPPKQPHRPKRAKQTYTCKCCGKVFEDCAYKGRVYCSRECNNRSHGYAGSDKQIATEEIQPSASSAAHREANELWKKGLTAYEVAQEINSNIGTVQGWIRTFKKRKDGPGQHRPFSEPFYRYIHARSTVEWLAVLNDEMRCNEIAVEETLERSFILICGITKATAGLFTLIELVGALGQNPIDGKTYAFCNAPRDYLVYFHWDGSSFQRTKRQRDYGRYVWPSEKHGKIIAITSQEFAFVLHGSKQNMNCETP